MIHVMAFVVVVSFRRLRRQGPATIVTRSRTARVVVVVSFRPRRRQRYKIPSFRHLDTSLVRERAVPRYHAQPVVVVVVVVYVKTEKIIVKLVHMIAIASSSSHVVVVVAQKKTNKIYRALRRRRRHHLRLRRPRAWVFSPSW